VVKMVLEKWKHWLEGAEHPFLVWTKHKNLEYLSCLGYREPGSQGTKFPAGP
jgi:hypothetical protein